MPKSDQILPILVGAAITLVILATSPSKPTPKSDPIPNSQTQLPK